VSAFPVPLHGFKPVAWNRSQVIQPVRIGDHPEFPACRCGDRRKLPAKPPVKQFLGIPAAERANHALSIPCLAYTGDQDTGYSPFRYFTIAAVTTARLLEPESPSATRSYSRSDASRY